MEVARKNMTSGRISHRRCILSQFTVSALSVFITLHNINFHTRNKSVKTGIILSDGPYFTLE